MLPWQRLSAFLQPICILDLFVRWTHQPSGLAAVIAASATFEVPFEALEAMIVGTDLVVIGGHAVEAAHLAWKVMVKLYCWGKTPVRFAWGCLSRAAM